jgi:cellulose synthase operon protein C
MRGRLRGRLQVTLESRSVRRALLVLVVISACRHTPKPVSVAPLPANAYAHYLAGKYALYQDDAAAAVSELEQAAKAAPEQPMISVELARALAKAKQAARARDVLATARTKWPDHANVWLASGDVLADDAAQRSPALAAYRRAIKLEPTDERGYLGLARVQLAAKDTLGAEKTLRQLVTKLPESVDGHYRLAQRLAANGKQADAVVELRAVLERDPDHLDARIDLARTLRRLGKLEEAVSQTRSAFDRAGQPMDLAEELYWVLCEADDRQGAIDLLTLLDDDRSDADALSTIAAYNRGLGRLAEARAVAVRIKSLDADASVIAVAETDAAEGRIESALEALLKIAESSPRFLQARSAAVEILMKEKRAKLALELLAPLRAKLPTNADIRYAEALALAAAGEKAKARAAAKAFTGRDPVAVAYAQARIHDALGDSTAALALLEPALKANPEHLGALNLAGYLLARRNERLADAERYLARARDLQPGDPSVLDSWGWLLVQQGRSREAVRALDRAARFAPREPEIRLHLAAAWAADGAPRHAGEILDRAVAQDPGLCLSYDTDMKRGTVFAMLLVAACSKGPSDDQCKKLLNHLVDLEFKKAGAAASSDQMKAEIAKQKSAVSEAKSKEFMEQCTKKMSKGRVDCALKANELEGDNGVAKCDESK